MKKKNMVLKLLFCFIFLCLLLIGCKRESRDGDVSGRQSGRNTIGVFSITGIPMDYEGKYVFLEDGSEHLIGVEKINSITKDWSEYDLILPKISNGAVSIPLWNFNETNTRYSGNHSFDRIKIEIHEKPQITKDDDNRIGTREFGGVIFENGNASRNWTAGNR